MVTHAELQADGDDGRNAPRAARSVTGRRRHGRGRAQEAGFTLIEILVAMSIAVIALAGMVGLMKTSGRSVSYSRHATEAAMLGESLMEQLALTPAASLASGNDTINVQGTGTGSYARTWTITWDGANVTANVVVTIGWYEEDGVHSVTYKTRRAR